MQGELGLVAPVRQSEQRVGKGPADARLPLVDVGVGALLPRRGEHHAFARPPGGEEESLDLVSCRKTAGDGLAVHAAVRVGEAGREPCCARLHGFHQNPAHVVDLVTGGGALVGRVPHHVEAERAMPQVAGEVQHRAAPVHQLHVLGIRLKIPYDAGGQRSGIHVLDVFERLHDHIVMFRPGGGDAESAIAGDDGGDPMVGRRP